MYSGRHGNYFWLADRNCSLGQLADAYPEAFIGKYIAITSFDSGRLTPTPNEQHAGWRVDGPIAYSPQVEQIAELPCDQYDEWYVFDQPRRLENVEVFVNYVEFSPVQPSEQFKGAGHTICGMPAGDFVSARLDEQRRFWSQLERISPEAYAADGDWLVFTTENKPLVELIAEWISTSTGK